jgi:type IV pilus assembly protein PilB
MSQTDRAVPPALEPSDDDAARARRQAELLRLPYEPLERPPDAELWDLVPLELLARFSCVPLRRAGRRLVLAFGGLEDIQKLDELEYLLRRPIDAVIAPLARVSELLRRHRGGEILLEQASESLRLQLVAEDETNVIDLESLPAESPIVRLVDSLIVGAIDKRASDIHIETRCSPSTASTACCIPRSSRSTSATTTPSSAASR